MEEKGQGGKVIASVVNGVPFWGITTNPKIPEIKDGKQLNGYSVATFPSPSTARRQVIPPQKEGN